jgi:hypothetical protein
VFVVAQRRINARLHFQKSPDEPEQIRQAIQISYDERIYVLAVFLQAHDASFGAAADGSGNVEGGG